MQDVQARLGGVAHGWLVQAGLANGRPVAIVTLSRTWQFPAEQAAEEIVRTVTSSLTAGWQPIETAPKDGQAFLACESGIVTIVDWDDVTEEWVQSYDGVGKAEPTHWMPLPEAP